MKWAIGFVMASDERLKRKAKIGWRIIRFGQGYRHYPLGAAVHCFLVFQSSVDGIDMVYETSDIGYRTTTLAQRSNGTPVDIFIMPGDGTLAFEHSVNLLEQKTPYAYLTIANFVIVLAAERAINLSNQFFKKPYQPMPPWPNIWDSDNTVYCTESSIKGINETNITTPWSKLVIAGTRCPHLYELFLKREYKMVSNAKGKKLQTCFT